MTVLAAFFIYLFFDVQNVEEKLFWVLFICGVM